MSTRIPVRLKQLLSGKDAPRFPVNTNAYSRVAGFDPSRHFTDAGFSLLLLDLFIIDAYKHRNKIE